MDPQQIDPRMLNALLGKNAQPTPGQLTTGEAFDQTAQLMPNLYGAPAQMAQEAPIGGRAAMSGDAPEISGNPQAQASMVGNTGMNTGDSAQTAMAIAQLMRQKQLQQQMNPEAAMAGGQLGGVEGMSSQFMNP